MPNIAPDHLNISLASTKIDISTEADFVDNWLTLIPYEVLDHRGGKVIERGECRIGAEWHRQTSLRADRLQLRQAAQGLEVQNPI
ncbi:MAG: hypothetical protein QM676_14010 [Novosphingobium sp.]